MRVLAAAESSHLETLCAIKHALDPEGILAPGRYDGTHFPDPGQQA